MLALLTARTAWGGEVYSGEPLGEALPDLSKVGAVLTSHELVSASPLLRTDVFRLVDGRLLAITSKSRAVGQPYSIDELRVTQSPQQKLTKKLPTQSGVDLPHR